ncbi:hypothetical protein V8F33_009927 [Rhypophila sp. PSN 637]
MAPSGGTPGPAFTKIPKDLNYGYRPFRPSINLNEDVSKGIPNPLKCMKLCGPTKNDAIYFVDYHVAKALRGTLRFAKGLCLLNGPNKYDTSAIVAGAGDLDSQTITTGGNSGTPNSLSASCRRSVIMMPALNPERNRQEMVEKIMYAGTTFRQPQPGIPYHGLLSFRFSIEIGLERPRRRAEFEWVAVAPSGPPTSGPTSPLSPVLPASKDDLIKDDDKYAADPDNAQLLAELIFSSAWSCDHLMTLNLKGAALTGELGNRWTLMVVMTALRINYLRREGRTNSLKKTLSWFKEKSTKQNEHTKNSHMWQVGLAGFF